MTESPTKKLFSEAAIMFVGLVSKRGFTFLSIVIIARHLQPDGYGLIRLGAALLTFSGMIFTLGLDDGISRFLPRYEELAEKRKVLVSSFHIGIVSSIGGAALFMLLSYRIANFLNIPRAAPVFTIFSAAIPILVVYKLQLGTIRGTKKSLPFVYTNHVIMPTVRFAMIALLWLLGFGVIGIAFGYLAGYIVAVIVGFYFIHRDTPLLNSNIKTPREYRALLHFSLPLVLSGFMYQVLMSSDVFLLGYFTSSSSAIGIYQGVYPLGNLLFVVLVSFRYIVLPIFSETDGVDEISHQNLYGSLTKWTFLFSVPLALLFVGFPFTIIRLTFGEQYVSGARVLQVLVIGLSSHFLLGPNAGVLKAIGRTREVMIFVSIAALSNILLNIVLIPAFGILGAAISTALAYPLQNALMSFQLYRSRSIKPISLSTLLVGVRLILVFFISWWIVTRILSSPTLQLVMTSVLFGLGYTVIIFRNGLSDREVKFVEEIEDARGIDLGPIKNAINYFN